MSTAHAAVARADLQVLTFQNAIEDRCMNKRIFVASLAALVVFAGGCTTTGTGSGDPAARRKAIDAGVDSALSNLFQQAQGSQDLVNRAAGVLVFPSVGEAGFIVGASRGSGALRVGGKTVSYHATTSGSIGLQAGAQSTAVFLLFMTQDALRNFQNSRGWTVGADASVTLITVGATAQVTTATAQQPVIGYVLSNRGLMAGITMDGTRITQLEL
jgi:lipid-binding SYLF domain-containing protein